MAKTSKSPSNISIKSGDKAAKKAAVTAPNYENIENLHKVDLAHIELNDLPKEKPDLHQPGISKDALIAEWLEAFIQKGLANKKLTENHLLPKKAILADLLGVSVGTVQNAFRIIEDHGFVVSKQRIGTIISNPEHAPERVRKLTSKRDIAVKAIQVLIQQRGIKVGEALPSAREVAKLINSAPNTTRLALEFLAGLGIVDDKGHRGNKANWYLKATPNVEKGASITTIESTTLIDLIEEDLKKLIALNYSTGEKLPSHLELADKLKVSIKTVHDAMGRLMEQNIVQSLRGRYGTFITNIPTVEGITPNKSKKTVTEQLQYSYEKVEEKLLLYIAQAHANGDKLPPMTDLAHQFDVSSNTVRKALQNMATAGYLRFERGRFGGTFVNQLPDIDISIGTKGATQAAHALAQTLREANRKKATTGARRRNAS